MKMEIRRKDVILVCLFTIGFFCIALWGLGSHSIPQTEQELSARGDGAKEVVLYFEEGQQLSDLLLFIGYRAAGEVTVSVAAGADWQIVQSGEELDSVFAWNEIPVSYRTTCLGLVFSERRMCIFINRQSMQKFVGSSAMINLIKDRLILIGNTILIKLLFIKKCRILHGIHR